MILRGPITFPDANLSDPLSPAAPFTGGAQMVDGLTIGTYVVGSPAYGGETYAGIYARTCFDDWYEHIHYLNATFDLGAISGETTRAFKIWNAYLSPRHLLSIDGLIPGVSITPLPPMTFAAIEQRSFTLTVAAQGDPSFTATLTFNWSDAVDYSLRVSGSRVVPLPWCKRAPMSETLSWRTGVHRNTQQREMLRATPVQTYDVQLLAKDIASAQHPLRNWIGRGFAMPMAESEIATVTAGSVEIFCDTTRADWREFVMLIKSDAEYQVIGLAGVLPDRLLLAQPATLSYTGEIYPAATAQALTNPSRSTDGRRGYVAMTFRFMSTRDLSASDLPQYKGLDVLLHAPQLSAVDDEISRRLSIADNGLANPFVDIRDQKSKIVRPMRWALDKTEAWRVRRWLHARKGKLVPFWQPSFERDFVPAGVGPVGSSLVVRANSYATHGQGTDLAVAIGTGWEFRGIGGITVNGDGTMSIGLDAPLIANHADIRMVSLLARKQLALDSVSFRFGVRGRTEITTAVLEE